MAYGCGGRAPMCLPRYLAHWDCPYSLRAGFTECVSDSTLLWFIAFIHLNVEHPSQDVVHEFWLEDIIVILIDITSNRIKLIWFQPSWAFIVTARSTWATPAWFLNPALQLDSWRHLRGNDWMSFSLGKFYGFLGMCWNAWMKICNDSNTTWSSKTRKHKTNASTKRTFLSHRIA